MKRQLLLLRHAKAEKNDSSASDEGRPLTKKGRRTAAAVRKAMRSAKLSPDLVLVSAAARTMETAKMLEPWKNRPTIGVESSLYLAPAAALWERLRRIDDKVGQALLIGHNPGLQELALQLVGSGKKARASKQAQRIAKAFPTGALAVYTVDCSWSEIVDGKGKLTRFVRPKDLSDAD